MKVFTTLSAVLALASAESDAFFPHGGIRPLAQQQLRGQQPAIQLRPTVQTYGVGMISQHQDPMASFGTAAARRAGAANAAAAAAAAVAAGTPVSPRFTYFEVNQQMQQPILPMREGEMFEYDVNYVESKKSDKKSGSVVGASGDSVLGIKESGDVYRFQKGDYDVKVNIKGVEASSYRKPEDKERDVEVKINGHAGGNAKKLQDKVGGHDSSDMDGRRRVDVFDEQDSYSRSMNDNRLEDDDQKHDVQVKIKSASGSRKLADKQSEIHLDHVTSRQQHQQKNDYRARQHQDFDGHDQRQRMMSYHRLNQDRMRHMSDRQRMVTADRQVSDRQMSDRQMSDRQMSDRQMSPYSNIADMSDRQMMDRQMAERQMVADRKMSELHMADRHMTDRQMTDRHMSERQMGDRHMSDRQMGDRHMSVDRRLSGGHSGHMDVPNERRVYDERLRMMSDRRMADRRMADRRHLLPAYRQRFNNELNEQFTNAGARRTINNNERSRLYKREAGFDYSVVASHPTQMMYRSMAVADNMMPFDGRIQDDAMQHSYNLPAAAIGMYRGDFERKQPFRHSMVEY